MDAAKVQVAAPEFTQSPQPTTVKEGETIKLTCQLKGNTHWSVFYESVPGLSHRVSSQQLLTSLTVKNKRPAMWNMRGSVYY